MLASALVTVIVAFPAVVPDFTVTVFPLTLTVAILLLFEETLNAPVFPLTVNVPLFGYVYIPLVEDNVNFPSALSIFATFVTVVVLYPVLLTRTVTFNDDAFIIWGIFSLNVFPSVEYSIFASLGFTVTSVKALCTFPSYTPIYGTTIIEKSLLFDSTSIV